MLKNKSVNNKLERVVKKILYSKWTIFIVNFILTILGLFFLSLFLFGDLQIDGKSIQIWKDQSKLWIPLVWLFIATFSSMMGITGDIYYHRYSNKMFSFYFLYLITYLFNSWLFNLYFELAQTVFLMGIVSWSFYNWKKSQKKSKSNDDLISMINIKKAKTGWLIMYLIGLISIGIGLDYY